jgi:hypothetical protein
MVSSGMLRHAALVRTDISEERVRRLLVAASVVPKFTDSCHPDEGGAKFL